MSVKVYGVPMSAGSIGCVMLARDLAVGDMVLCDLSKGEQHTPEFLAINPWHQIPALEDGAVKIGEAGAILRYLAGQYKPDYYPIKTDPATAAKIDFAVETFSCSCVKEHMQTVFVVFEFCGKKEEAEQKEANKKYVDAVNKWLEKFLPAGNRFVCGDKLSIADFRAVPFLFAATQPSMEKVIGLVMPERAKKYVEDFIAATTAATIMSDFHGCSLKEFPASKAAAAGA